MEGIFVQLARGRNTGTIATILLVIFAAVTAYVKIAGPDNVINSVLYVATVTHRVYFMNNFMVALSEYGREYFWIPLVALMWFFGKGKVRFSAYVMIVAFILSIVAGEILKPALAVPRPFYFYTFKLLIPPPTDFSYPSGHALIVWAGAASTFYYLKKRYALLLSIEAILVSISRVYVGVHWPLDVVGGAVLGVMMAMIAVMIAESNFGRRVYRSFAFLSLRKQEN